ncbi:hypothetical protein SBADM41S_03738 [Streptomyces badius]
MRSGCSACAERTSPDTAAPARSRGSSPLPQATAPLVTTASRPLANRSSASQAWRTPRTRCTSRCVASGVPSAPPEGTRTTPSSATPARPSAATAPSSRASAGCPSPRTCQPLVSSAGSAAVFRHSILNSVSVARGTGSARTVAADSGRSSSVPTESTGCPEVSATSMETEPLPTGRTRTRTDVVETAYRSTPSQANGSTGSSAAAALNPMACSTASSSAGWTPNRSASACSACARPTSAKASPSRFQTARSPWKAGP